MREQDHAWIAVTVLLVACFALPVWNLFRRARVRRAGGQEPG
jgi:hypothetical protein